MDLVCEGVCFIPSLPQADLDLSAVNLHSSVELSEAWALLCSHLILPGGEAALQGLGGSGPNRARPFGLLSYYGGLQAASTWDLQLRGVLGALPSIKHLTFSPGPQDQSPGGGSASHSHPHRGCHNNLSFVELLPIWTKMAARKNLQVRSCNLNKFQKNLAPGLLIAVQNVARKTSL